MMHYPFPRPGSWNSKDSIVSGNQYSWKVRDSPISSANVLERKKQDPFLATYTGGWKHFCYPSFPSLTYFSTIGRWPSSWRTQRPWVCYRLSVINMEFSTLMITKFASMKKKCQTKDRIGIPEQREINRNGEVFKGKSRKNQKCKKMGYSRKF